MIRKGMFIGDRYEIIEKVGSGGMSDVYKAKCHKLNRFVAVKVLKSEFSEDKSFVSKFKVEAQSAAGLTHPNIVNVYDVGEDNGLYFIVMELIEGITLKNYIERKGKLPSKEAVSIAIQVAQGIEAAHNNHIIHRDIKPQNIIISKEGKVKVTDFGIARAASANTINSNAMGSVHYISPEQARGGYIDEKSDIYSLGITLYEMITGVVPFEGDSTVTIALSHIQEEIVSPKKYVEDLPISVEKIIEKCTQKKPDRRYLKLTSLLADLKKSLISPDEDFVQIIHNSANNATVMISDDEVLKIRKEAGLNDDDEDEEIEVVDKDLDEEEIDEFDDVETNEKFDKIVQIGAIVSGIVMLIFVILLISNVVGGGCSKEPVDSQQPTTQEESSTDELPTLDDKHVYVPNLIGLTEQEAIDALKEASLGYRIETDYDNVIEAGKVISQSEVSNNIVAKQTRIDFVVSLGAKSFDIPDVLGKDKDEAKKQLEELGLNVNLLVETQAVTETYEDGQVTRTTPGAPSQLKFGDTITVYYFLLTESNVKVPSLINLTLDDAKKKLNELGLKIETEEDYSSRVATGRIIAQGYEADSEVPTGTSVLVTISLGEKPTETEPEREPEPTTIDYSASNISEIKLEELVLPLLADGVTKASAGTMELILKYSYKEGTKTTHQDILLKKFVLDAAFTTTGSYGFEFSIPKEAELISGSVKVVLVLSYTDTDETETEEQKDKEAEVYTIKDDGFTLIAN